MHVKYNIYIYICQFVLVNGKLFMNDVKEI